MERWKWGVALKRAPAKSRVQTCLETPPLPLRPHVAVRGTPLVPVVKARPPNCKDMLLKGYVPSLLTVMGNVHTGEIATPGMVIIRRLRAVLCS